MCWWSLQIGLFVERVKVGMCVCIRNTVSAGNNIHFIVKRLKYNDSISVWLPVPINVF